MKQLRALSVLLLLSGCFIGPKAHVGAHSYGVSTTKINDGCIKQALQAAPNIESFAADQNHKKSHGDVLNSYHYDYRLKGYDYPFRLDVQIAEASSSILHSQEDSALISEMSNVSAARKRKRDLMIPTEKAIIKSCNLPTDFFQENCVGEKSCAFKTGL